MNDRQLADATETTEGMKAAAACLLLHAALAHLLGAVAERPTPLQELLPSLLGVGCVDGGARVRDASTPRPPRRPHCIVRE